MKKLLLLFIVITAMGMDRVYSQTLVQTYTDRCTGETKVFTVPMNGQTIVTYYNKSRTFTAQDFKDGTLHSWLESTYLWWTSLSPCSTANAESTAAQQTTQQTAQQAATAASNATANTTNNAPSPTTNPPTTSQTSNPPTQDTSSQTPPPDQSDKPPTQQDSTSQGDSSSTSEGSSTDSTDSQTEQGTDQSSSNENSSSENTNSETSTEESEVDTTEEDTSETTEEDTSETTEEESSEEETKEESEEETKEESEEETKEESEEETKEDKEENKKEKKKRKRKLAPPVVTANIMSQQLPTGEYSQAATFGLSQSSLLGDKTYGVNVMVYDNMKQFMLNLNYSKVHINKKGRINRVYSTSAGLMKMFTTYVAMNNHSLTFLGKKGSVTGVSLGISLTNLEVDIKNGMILLDQQLLGGNITAFYTKPINYSPKLTISPMLAVSSSFISFDTYQKTTTFNSNLMFIGGSNFTYKITQRFGLNLGANLITSTLPDFPILKTFTIGGRFNF